MVLKICKNRFKLTEIIKVIYIFVLLKSTPLKKIRKPLGLVSIIEPRIGFYLLFSWFCFLSVASTRFHRLLWKQFLYSLFNVRKFLLSMLPDKVLKFIFTPISEFGTFPKPFMTCKMECTDWPVLGHVTWGYFLPAERGVSLPRTTLFAYKIMQEKKKKKKLCAWLHFWQGERKVQSINIFSSVDF